MSVQFRVELLGVIRVRTEKGEEVLVRSRKALHLLAYLALHPGQAIARERLLDLFWSDLDESAGRDNLSTTLGLLRRALTSEEEASPFQADRHTVSLRPGALTTDVAEFEASLLEVQQTEAPAQRRAQLEQALALYTGELLPGLYSDWAVELQDRLASRYADALRSLLQLLLHSEDFEAALVVSARAIAADPYDETAYRIKMRACAALERPALAQETYQTLLQRLRDDLHAAPSHLTRELAERIQRQPESFAPATVPSPPSPSLPDSPDRSRPIAPFVFAMPPNRTRFFGREPEMRLLRALLESGSAPARLVTITGPGGVGKTRVVLELAQQLQSAFPDGICFLSLADITDPTLLPSLLAHALHIELNPGKDLFTRILETLQGRRLLLILDNYEQLVEEGSLFVRSLLDHLESLQIVLTSRLRLELEGEREFLLSPLPTPSEAANLEALAACASVRLFIDRAQQRNTDFTLTEHNRVAVGNLCAKLEGIPLALELAAGWAGMLHPEQMLERMEERFDLLVSRRRDIAPRHRTLRAAMEGSYRLLSPELQRLFCELAVFRGGFTLETLQEFRALLPQQGDPPTAISLLPQLAELQAHSLIRVEERQVGQRTQIRYRLLETVREFGWRRWNAEERGVLHDRHALCFQQRLRRLRGETDHTEKYSPDELRRLLDEIESDMDNLRAALRRLLFEGDPIVGAQMAVDLDWFWMVRNFHVERKEWAKIAFDRMRAVELPADLREAVAIIWIHHLSQEEQVAWYEERLVEMRVRGETLRLGHLLIRYGEQLQEESRKTACMEESLALFTQEGDHVSANLARAYLAGTYTHFGRYDRSLPLLEACLRYNREVGREWDVARILSAKGAIAYAQGNLTLAQECLHESLSFFQRVEFQYQENHVRSWLSAVYAAQGQVEEANALLAEALQYFEEHGKLPPIGLVPDRCGNALLYIGRLTLAERLLENSMQFAEAPYDNMRELVRLALVNADLETAQSRYTQWQELLRNVDPQIAHADRQAFGAILAWKQRDFQTAWADLAQCLPTIQQSERWPLLLTCLPTAAALTLAAGCPEEAAQLLGSWAGLYARMALVALPYEQTDCAAVSEQIQAVLEPDAFSLCRQEGAQWTAQHTCNVILRLIPALLQSAASHLYLA